MAPIAHVYHILIRLPFHPGVYEPSMLGVFYDPMNERVSLCPLLVGKLHEVLERCFEAVTFLHKHYHVG
jgi:hypothetical protein